MGKKSTLWLSNIDQAVLGIYPKQTCTLKEGDTAYTFQRKIHALVVSLARKDRLLYTQWAQAHDSRKGRIENGAVQLVGEP